MVQHGVMALGACARAKRRENKARRRMARDDVAIPNLSIPPGQAQTMIPELSPVQVSVPLRQSSSPG